MLHREIEEDDAVDLLFWGDKEESEESESEDLFEHEVLLENAEISGNIFHKINYFFGIEDILNAPVLSIDTVNLYIKLIFYC